MTTQSLEAVGGIAEQWSYVYKPKFGEFRALGCVEVDLFVWRWIHCVEVDSLCGGVDFIVTSGKPWLTAREPFIR